MSLVIAICSWERFQHYKDRDPPWIKLSRDLLSSEKWVLATDPQRVLLISVMLLAARHNNKIPNNPKFIQRAAHLDQEPDIAWLIETGFCHLVEVDSAQAEEKPAQEKWASRYVSAQTRAQVLHRDGEKCLMCSSVDDLEIDHITPISQGGSGEISNLQTLCRSCNRKKRTRVADARQTLRRKSSQRSPEAEERENRGEREEIPPIPPTGGVSARKRDKPFDPKTIPNLDITSWEQWLAYRAERKPAIKPASMQAAAEELAAFGAQQSVVVKHSMANGYQGLFPPKTNGAAHQRAPPMRLRTADEIEAEERARGDWDAQH